VLNAVTGRGSEIGDYLTTHPGVNCISFTGGDTGLDICRKAGMVPVQMELGGKDVAIVCDDADLDLGEGREGRGGEGEGGGMLRLKQGDVGGRGRHCLLG
jgi:glyceraldehyde-3-phosphate dehydrogenase (NADP+)